MTEFNRNVKNGVVRTALQKSTLFGLQPKCSPKDCVIETVEDEFSNNQSALATSPVSTFIPSYNGCVDNDRKSISYAVCHGDVTEGVELPFVIVPDTNNDPFDCVRIDIPPVPVKYDVPLSSVVSEPDKCDALTGLLKIVVPHASIVAILISNSHLFVRTCAIVMSDSMCPVGGEEFGSVVIQYSYVFPVVYHPRIL